jgi:hypothetical protein
VNHRRPGAFDDAGPNHSAHEEETRHDRQHQRSPENTGYRPAGSGHTKGAADVEHLADEERQRHHAEEFDQPDLDELWDAATNPVEGEHTTPDELQHTHGSQE